MIQGPDEKKKILYQQKKIKNKKIVLSKRFLGLYNLDLIFFFFFLVYQIGVLEGSGQIKSEPPDIDI
jgi:hypothetical protein